MDVAGKVAIHIMDINGRVIDVMNEGYKTPGDYTEQLNANNYPMGNYIAELVVNGQKVQSIKLVKAN